MVDHWAQPRRPRPRIAGGRQWIAGQRAPGGGNAATPAAAGLPAAPEASMT